VGVGVGVGGGETELDSDVLPLLEGLAPCVRDAVGGADAVELPESVVEGVEAAVPVPLEVGLPVDVAEGVREAVALLEIDTLGVLLEEAPGLRVAVGETDVVELEEVVVEGVKDPVPVPLGVGEGVGVGVGVGGGVALLDRLVLPVLDWEAPEVKLAVGEADTVELLEAVVLGVREAVPVQEGVGLPVEVGEGVGGGVQLLDSELLPLLEGEAPLVSEAVG